VEHIFETRRERWLEMAHTPSKIEESSSILVGSNLKFCNFFGLLFGDHQNCWNLAQTKAGSTTWFLVSRLGTVSSKPIWQQLGMAGDLSFFLMKPATFFNVSCHSQQGSLSYPQKPAIL
jgi:hypothetical protein